MTSRTGATGASAMTPYKIGKGADRLGRRWQAEDESGQHRFARRAYTPEGAVRLMSRDVAFYERTGRKSLFQRRRLWWVQTRCRVGWHRWFDRIGHGQTGRFCLTCGVPASDDSRAGSGVAPGVGRVIQKAGRGEKKQLGESSVRVDHHGGGDEGQAKHVAGAHCDPSDEVSVGLEVGERLERPVDAREAQIGHDAELTRRAGS